MTIIRKLILREWSKSFLSAVLVLFILIAVADLISGFLRSSVTPLEVIINFGFDIPKWCTKIFPLSCLVASLFSLNRLRSSSELIAIFSSGFALKQFFIVILFASSIVFSCQIFLSGFIEPALKKASLVYLPEGAKKFSSKKGKGLKISSLNSGKIWFKSENYFFSFSAFDKQKNELKDVLIHFFNQDFKGHTSIHAETATFKENFQWELSNGFYLLSLSDESFTRFKPLTKSLIVLNETLDDFKQIDSDITTLNLFSLINYIYRISRTGINTDEYQILLYDKFASALICIIFALLAVGPLYQPNQRHSSVGLNILFTFVFSIIYWLFYSSSLALGTNGKVHPAIGAFAIPLLFISYIIFRYRQNSSLD